MVHLSCYPDREAFVYFQIKKEKNEKEKLTNFLKNSNMLNQSQELVRSVKANVSFSENNSSLVH